MALTVAKGSFAAPATATDQVVNIGWQPSVVLFWLTKQTAAGFLADRGFSFGWMNGSAQGCLGASAEDAVTVNSECGMSIRSDRVLRGLDCIANSVTTYVEAYFTSMDSDGFTITFANAASGREYIVHWLAIGGADITNTWVGEILSPATTPQAVGYSTPNFQPDLLLVFGNGAGTIPRDDVGIKFSLGAASAVAEQAVAYFGDANSIPTQQAVVQETSHIVRTLTAAGADHCVGALQSFDTNGFTINWTTVQTTQRPFLCLALKGGEYKVTTDTQKTSTGGTKQKTGIGHTPAGLLFFGTNRAASSSIDTTVGDFSLGAGDGTTEGTVWCGGVDNVSTTDENQSTATDKVLRHAANPNTTYGEADISTLDDDGYTLNWTLPGGDSVAREFIVVSFGNLSANAQVLNPSADSADGNWTTDTGGTVLYAAIDEDTPSDTDYIKSELSPANSGCRVKLESGGDPESSTGHEIHWRIGRSATGTEQIDMIVKLYQGGGDTLGAGTLIADFTRTNVSATMTEFTETLSGAEADSITDYTALYLEFWANVP